MSGLRAPTRLFLCLCFRSARLAPSKGLSGPISPTCLSPRPGMERGRWTPRSQRCGPRSSPVFVCVCCFRPAVDVSQPREARCGQVALDGNPLLERSRGPSVACGEQRQSSSTSLRVVARCCLLESFVARSSTLIPPPETRQVHQCFHMFKTCAF